MLKAIKENWPLYLWVSAVVLFVALAAGVGIIKVMAWWQVAMHGCQGAAS